MASLFPRYLNIKSIKPKDPIYPIPPTNRESCVAHSFDSVFCGELKLIQESRESRVKADFAEVRWSDRLMNVIKAVIRLSKAGSGETQEVRAPVIPNTSAAIREWPDKLGVLSEFDPYPEFEFRDQGALHRIELMFPRPVSWIRWILRRPRSTEGVSQEPRTAPLTGKELLDAASEANLAGLALSGGGIRSATFGLGALQLLSETNMLRRFDLISSVSGGGYLSSWLSAWIHREGFEVADDVLGSDADGESTQERWRKQRPIHFLRRYSNYLTPRKELFSGDIWAAVAIYLRNLLLNLVTAVSWIFVALLIPHFLLRLIQEISPYGEHFVPGSRQAVWLIVLMVLIIGYLYFRSVEFLSASLVTLNPEIEQTPISPESLGHRGVNRNVLAPIFAVSCLVTVILAAYPMEGVTWMYMLVASSIGSVSHCAIWFGIERKAMRLVHSRTALFVSALLSGALVGTMLSLVSTTFPARVSSLGELLQTVMIGPPTVMAVLLLGSILQIGLVGISLDDPQREWLGRTAGLLILYTLCWILLFFASVYFPPLALKSYLSGYRIVKTQFAEGHTWRALILLMSQGGAVIAWLVITIAGLITARGEKTEAPAFSDRAGEQAFSSTGSRHAVSRWRKYLADGTPYVAVAGLLLALAIVVFLKFSKQDGLVFQLVGNDVLFSVSVFLLLCVALGLIFAWRVDINEFSMHPFYRNRLVRCYLGATNTSRQPHAFTGFDPNDDLRLSALRRNRRNQNFEGPYPIFNATLNLTGGADLAFQKRRAVNFIFSPLFCGYERFRTADVLQHQVATVGAEQERSQAPVLGDEHLHESAYRRSDYYACGELKNRPTGLRLGTVMAISGAAASPNMGYYSSKPMAFLMTLANVRLGWWLGNPRRNDRWQRQGPIFGLKYLLAELLGDANDRRSHVYLSDGGHFENLGLYELVRRRCRFIWVCDGGRDPDYLCEDLSAAIEKCRTDFGVNVEIDIRNLKPLHNPGHCKSHFAVGQIGYGNGHVGTLVYLKLSIVGDEPLDVRAYHERNSSFPHDTTADQWFDEDKFEAYRELGFQAAASAVMSGLFHPEPTEEVLELRKALQTVFRFPLGKTARASSG